MRGIMGSRKKRKLVFAGLVCAVFVLGGCMIAMAAVSENEGKDKKEDASVPVSVEVVNVQPYSVNVTDEYAAEIFKYKVSSTDDTAGLVDLFDAMQLENVSGKYTVEIAEEEGVLVLSIAVQLPVAEQDKDIFDANLEKCAQQMMALIPDINAVEWTYSIASSGEKEETVIVSVDVQAASQSLESDVRMYGESVQTFEKLLEKQAGKNV